MLRTRYDALVLVTLVALSTVAIAGGDPPRSTADEDEARAWYAALQAQAGLRRPGTRPFLLEGSLTVPVPKGDDWNGRIRWLSDGSGRWRVEAAVPGQWVTGVGESAEHRWRSGTHRFDPEPVELVTRLWRPLDESPDDLRFHDEPLVTRSARSKRTERCVRFRFGEDGRWNELCGNVEDGALAGETASGAFVPFQARYDPPVRLGDLRFPSGFTIRVDGTEVARVKDIVARPFDPELPGAFDPPPGALLSERCETTRDPVLLDSSKVQPRYPRRMRELRRNGEVLVGVQIGADGHVELAQAISVWGGEPFARAAIEAIRQWRYRPATCDGSPVARDVMIRMTFRLN